jgi:Protein of unknown function (DUF2786)
LGKANRERRRAKLKDRERERKRRQHRRDRPYSGDPHEGGWPSSQYQGQAWRPSPAETAGILVGEAVGALDDDDPDAFAKYVARLATPPGGAVGTDWPRIVGRAIWTIAEQVVVTGWRRGWQPAELVRQADRSFGARHTRMATDLVAGEMRRYAAAAVDERWAEQLAALGAQAWWGRDDEHLERWREREGLDRAVAIGCALETVYTIARLPELSPLLPLPGTATRTAQASRAVGRTVDQRMLERVRALLAKAESTEFPEEAEALTARAQGLMARHSIDEALLAATVARQSGKAGPGSEASGCRLFVDSPYEAAKAILLDVIAKANRCRAVWHKQLGLSSVVGFPSDLNAVELLFTSLLVQATTTMLAAGARQDAAGRSRTRSFRQSFLAAYAQRIGERLAEASGEAERQAVAESPGANLLPVLAARHRVVDEAFEAMFPGSEMFSLGSVSNSEGWYAGRAAADLATLQRHREVTAA